jgi:lysophospholipase
MLLGKAGVVPGFDMTSEAALAKLSYLLTHHSATPDSIARDMRLPISGELTEHSKMVFQHPGGGLLPKRDTRLMELGYAITKGDLRKVQELLRGEPAWLLNEADYNGFTPLVSYLYPKYLGLRGCMLTNHFVACCCDRPKHRDTSILPHRRCQCAFAK